MATMARVLTVNAESIDWLLLLLLSAIFSCESSATVTACC